jgi:hypothetical protein
MKWKRKRKKEKHSCWVVAALSAHLSFPSAQPNWKSCAPTTGPTRQPVSRASPHSSTGSGACLPVGHLRVHSSLLTGTRAQPVRIFYFAEIARAHNRSRYHRKLRRARLPRDARRMTRRHTPATH